jgi:cytochrome c oxidase subunit 2
MQEHAGESLVLEFTAPEVVMGFYCPELNLRTVIMPGQVAHVPWTVDRAGRFDFACDVFCGDGHEGMQGQLVVAWTSMGRP